MKKVLIALTAMVPVTLIGAWTGDAHSISLRPLSQSLIEQIGCEGGPSREDRCPYGYRWDRHPNGRSSCEPCRQKQGSRDRDWNDRYEEPRRYRDYGDYGSRRYRQYEDDRYYEPRRYPRESY
jgi:hypothetical protein